MAETVVVTVNHSMVLDEPDAGQPAKKKSDTGSKSPGKGGRRWGKGSLFKRTFSDQDVSQKADRPPSGRSKARKESQEGIGSESPSIGRVCSGGDISLRPPDPTAAQEEGEGDRGKFGDPKKLYKQNKDLHKTNAQLSKLIDTLKHEKDSLALDKSKLKSDLKSTEKELKKANSSLSSAKSEVERLRAKSHKHGGGVANNMGEGPEGLQERVRQLEAELSSRDEKLEMFRKRLGGRLSQMDNLGGDNVEYQVAADKEVTLRGPEWGKLEEENCELRQRVGNLEGDLNMLLKLVDDQQKEEFAQSSSTELSFFSTDAPSSTYSDHRRGNRASPPPFSSPRNSPSLQRRNQTSEDVATLQTCLQQALEEKKAAELLVRSLQTELDSVRAELEEAKSSWGQEKDRLLRQLLKAHGESDARQKVPTQDQGTQHSLTDVPAATSSVPETQEQSEVFSQTGTRTRMDSSGSLTSSSELEKSTGSDSTDAARPGEKRERTRGRRGPLQKQSSRENFTAALAIFQSGETAPGAKRERRPSDTSQGSARSSASPAPSPRMFSTESRSQSVTVSGKPPIPPQSSSGHHSRQSSTDETRPRSPTKTSAAAKRSSWTVTQRRKSFEEQSPDSLSAPPPQHSRTASSPVMTKTLGSPLVEKETEKVKEEKRFDEERARKEQEKRKKELEAEEKRKRELEAKRKREAEEKERQRKEREERRGREERERERKRELEEKSRREKEEMEKKRVAELERRRKQEERERVRREREEREAQRKRELEEKLRREKEEREKKRQEELERKRQLEEKKRKEQQAERERQKAREIELERKRKEEQEAALRKQREEEEQKKRQEEAAALKQQREEEEKKKRQQELEERLRLEERRRNAEKAAQAAIDPQPSKINQHQSPFGSIAMRRAAFEQNSSPSNSPPVALRRNAGRSPAQRPKSMDVSALMSTPPPSSPAVSPTAPRSPQISSISIKTSKSPQGSPVLGQRKEIKEVPVTRGSTITKPSPPVTTATPRTATVSITTTSSSSPPLRRAQTISLSPTSSLAVSTPDLTSVGATTNGFSSPTHEASWSPGSQHRTISTGNKSPLSDRKMAKSVSFSPNLSTAGRPPGILKPSTPSMTAHSPSSGSKMRFGPTHLGLPCSDDMKKAQSLQNIPEHAMAEDTTPQQVTRTPAPAASHVNRRPRSERAKTTSLSRADTANLANLISKLQEKETPPLTNGVSSSAHPRTGFTPTGRPASMYGSITPSRTDVIPSSTKPKPHQRKMERRVTVGFALDKSSKKSRLLRWCQIITEDYDNIFIEDFGRSFSNGLAFCAILHHFIPHKIPYSSLNDTDRARNFKIAFEAAESEDIPSLLDIEDMVALPVPDWMSVMTYVSFIYKRFGSNGAAQQVLL